MEACFPRHLLFGSDCIGSAFLFEAGSKPVRIVEVPFIPLDPEYVVATYADFVAFLEAMATVPDGFDGSLPIVPNPALAGLEVHEKQPVVLGGDPASPENKVLLPPQTHAQACRFFNRVFREVRAQSRRR